MSPEQLAKQVFNLELPTTLSMLKSAFRAAARKAHSDVGGSDEAFRQVKSAYDMLLPLALVVDTAEQKVLKTVNDIPLSELGLGRKDNGSPCPRCESRGYTKSTYDTAAPYLQFELRRCSDCNGSGRFTLRSGRKVVCKRCYGIGSCHTRQRYTPKLETFYFVCSGCEGTGEIKVFNPVIIKGAIL